MYSILQVILMSMYSILQVILMNMYSILQVILMSMYSILQVILMSIILYIRTSSENLLMFYTIRRSRYCQKVLMSILTRLMQIPCLLFYMSLHKIMLL